MGIGLSLVVGKDEETNGDKSGSFTAKRDGNGTSTMIIWDLDDWEWGLGSGGVEVID